MQRLQQEFATEDIPAVGDSIVSAPKAIAKKLANA